MTQYLRNVTLWLRGFSWLWDDSRIRYKPGWGPWKFLPVYLLAHGIACVVLGIGVQPVSRWAGQRVKHAPWGWLAWLLDRLDRGHTANAGGLLWSTQPCEPHIRLAVVIAWVVVLGLTLI